jgi:rare lipoprotein A
VRVRKEFDKPLSLDAPLSLRRQVGIRGHGPRQRSGIGLHADARAASEGIERRAFSASSIEGRGYFMFMHSIRQLISATLAGAMIYGCAQLQQAPESELSTLPPADFTPSVPSVPPLPVPSASPTPEATAPSPPAAAVASPPAPDETTVSRQERGRISMYGRKFTGRKTASGEPFDPKALTMAHPSLPFGTRVRVTNLENQRSVEVVVNDRGPFVSGRIADLSQAAARRLGMVGDGVVEALLDIMQPVAQR